MKKALSFLAVLVLLLSVVCVPVAEAIVKLVIGEKALVAAPTDAEKADFRAYAESKFNELQEYSQGKPSNYSGAQWVIRDAGNAITQAKKFGVKVSDLQAKLPALAKKARRVDAEKKVEDLRAYGMNEPSGYFTAELPISDAEKALAKAKKAGAKVLDLQVRLSELKKKARRSYAERKINDLREYGQGKPTGYGGAEWVINDTEKAIATAKKSGVKVSDLQAQLPELKKRAKARG